jgi:hypothetical protein
MGLRVQANTDMTKFLNSDAGFAWPITVIDPSGTVANLKGFTTDIGQLIDPDTGVAVSGRFASVALSISDLTAAGLALPEGISDSSSKPWQIAFDDINGNPFTFKVQSSQPDRAIGIVTCVVEFYEV